MVDISQKVPSLRSASGRAVVIFGNPKTYSALVEGSLKKGDVLAVARIAGIQATKKTADLIPLAHPGLSLTSVNVGLDLLPPPKAAGSKVTNKNETPSHHGGVLITTHVACEGKTGVEMEALTAASVAALTIYDMCKAVDKNMLITGACITKKTGGKSGDWEAGPPSAHLLNVERQPSIHPESKTKTNFAEQARSDAGHEAEPEGRVSPADLTNGEHIRQAEEEIARILNEGGILADKKT